MFNKKLFSSCILIVFFLASCAVHKPIQNNATSSLKLIGTYELPHNPLFKNTTIGGLSGIDYDAANDLYYIISDDRSERNPARFYNAKIVTTTSGIDTVIFKDMHFFKQANGAVYPNAEQHSLNTPDPESIRFNPINKTIYWTSEGERIVNKKDTILINPAITIVDTNGNFMDSFPLPSNLIMHSFEKGPRKNGVLEGSTFSPDFKTYFVNVEEPLYEDGPRADIKPNNAWIRLYQFNVANKKNTAQYAYQLEPVAYEANPKTAFKINGVPEILWLNQKEMLVMERSFSSGRIACTIKIFKANYSNATNIINNISLSKDTGFSPIQKQLLLNMDNLGIYIDNVEGITFGPTLPNGHRTLILVADNNFDITEKTQFFYFELMP